MLERLYLLLCAIGIVLPFSQFAPFLLEHGLNAQLFFEQLFANRISAFFALDLIVSSVVLWVLVFTEGRKRGMKHLWVYVACNLAVGLSLALPLFLLMRERRLHTEATARTAGASA